MNGDLAPVPHGHVILWLFAIVVLILASGIVSALDFETESQFQQEQRQIVAIVKAAMRVNVAEVK